MGTVLGLSLTAGEVAWALVDAAQGTVLDHDAMEFAADAEIAGTAARGAYAIATTTGLEVDRVRLTWSDDAKHSGLRLRTKLRGLGLADVKAVPRAGAAAVAGEREHAYIPARIALAYGAAMATVDPREAITEPVAREPLRRTRGRRAASAAVGLSAAAALSVVCLGAGSSPQVAPAATTAEQTGTQDPGWVAVPAAPPNLDAANRKVVAPSATTEPTVVAVQRYDPAVGAPGAETPDAVPQAVTETPDAVPEPLAETSDAVPQAAAETSDAAPQAVAETTTQPHLTGVVPSASPGDVGPVVQPAPGPGFAEPAPSPPPGAQRTDPFNLFTPLA